MFQSNEGARGGGNDEQNATVDVVFRVSGFSAECTFLWARAAAIDTRWPTVTNIAGNVLLAYLVPSINLELALRYNAARSEFAEGTYYVEHEWTGALSYYVLGNHAFKVQAAITYDQGGDDDGFFSGVLAIQAHL